MYVIYLAHERNGINEKTVAVRFEPSIVETILSQLLILYTL